MLSKGILSDYSTRTREYICIYIYIFSFISLSKILNKSTNRKQSVEQSYNIRETFTIKFCSVLPGCNVLLFRITKFSIEVQFSNQKKNCLQPDKSLEYSRTTMIHLPYTYHSACFRINPCCLTQHDSIRYEQL